jgi:hypothetical protein
MSITPLEINSLKSDSWYVKSEIARTAFDRTGAENLLSTSLIMKLSSFKLTIYSIISGWKQMSVVIQLNFSRVLSSTFPICIVS